MTKAAQFFYIKFSGTTRQKVVVIQNVPGNWGLPRKPEKVQGVQQNGPWWVELLAKKKVARTQFFRQYPWLQ
jgi:hypothetical protein